MQAEADLFDRHIVPEFNAKTIKREGLVISEQNLLQTVETVARQEGSQKKRILDCD